MGQIPVRRGRQPIGTLAAALDVLRDGGMVAVCSRRAPMGTGGRRVRSGSGVRELARAAGAPLPWWRCAGTCHRPLYRDYRTGSGPGWTCWWRSAGAHRAGRMGWPPRPRTSQALRTPVRELKR
ncbi:hypothetical protein HBB16_13435 [Pseudonocardia sp. MCCB 268]|nr:hypothetical protein [Pseudonocardia cytotoxica]